MAAFFQSAVKKYDHFSTALFSALLLHKANWLIVIDDIGYHPKEDAGF